MIRKTSRQSGPAAVLDAGGKSNEQKPPNYLRILLFLTIFVGLSLPAEARQYALIDGGYLHGVGMKTDGMVAAWGNIRSHSIIEGLSGVVAIAAGYQYSFALKANGTAVAWGRNDHGQCNICLPGVMAAGGYHSLALKSDGTVVAWGEHSTDQTNVPVGLNLKIRFKIHRKGISPGVLLLLLD